MFDIERYLQEMRLKEFSPTDTLVHTTKQECMKFGKRLRQRPVKKAKIRKAAFIALPAAAILLAGVVLGAFLFSAKETAPASVVAFYTVDINPSVCVNVDEDEIVASVEYQNEDAKKLLEGMDIVGLPAADAIRKIIGAAEQAGYLNGEEKYVLVGRFGSNGDEELNDLQSQLEASLGDMIDLLVISGSIEDKQAADKKDVSAGLLKLSEMADGVQVTGDEKVADVVEDVLECNQDQFIAPTISASASDGEITLSWSELDFEAMGFIGDVTYKIVAGSTKDQVTSGGGHKIVQYDFNSTDDQPRSCTVEASSHGINPGDMKYFGIYAIYGGKVMKSNVIPSTMPEPNPSPTVEPSDTPRPTESADPQPSETPQPTEAPAPSPTAEPSEHTVSGYVSGQYVKLSWDKATEANFQGYKIVASKTNPNPKYPDDGYLKYITSSGTTSKSLYEGYGGLKANTYYYFSVTYLYSDGTKIAGNAVRLKVPEKEEEPEPTPAPTPGGDMVSTNISGSLGETKVNLGWGEVSHPEFKYYKVVAAKHSNPSYPADGYIAVVTNAGSTSGSYSISEFDAGETYYFAITVVYNDGTKLTGNDVAITMPGETPPEEPYVSTNISVSLNGNDVYASWSKITHGELLGYKVVASFNCSSPSYPANGYVKWITDTSATSYTIPESKIKSLSGYAPGKTCYFAITAVYNCEKRTGSPKSLVIPGAPEPIPTPTPEPTPTPTPSPTPTSTSEPTPTPTDGGDPPE